MGDIILLALVAGIENSREGRGGRVRDDAIVELLRTERILLFYAERFFSKIDRGKQINQFKRYCDFSLLFNLVTKFSTYSSK